jgi:hypothetical protein
VQGFGRRNRQVQLRMRRPGVRLASVGLAIAVAGGVACSAINGNLPAPGSNTVAPTGPGGSPALNVKGQPQVGVAGNTSTADAPSVAQTAAPAAPPASARNAVAPSRDASASASAPVPAPAASGAAATQNSASPALSTVEQSSAAQNADRKVIRSGQLTVEVTDMEGALAQVRSIATRGGGFVSASSTHVERVDNQDRTVADLTLQVRSITADGAISDLRALGKVLSENSSSQDVSEEYVDISANLDNLRASESAIVKLMDKATQIQDVLALQRELSNVRGQIDRLQGRQRFIDNRTEMTTIAVSLRLPPLESSTRPASGGAFDPAAVAQRGWQASLTLLRGVAETLIVVLAFSWWLVPFVAVGGYWLLHRRRGTQARPNAEPA